MRNSRISGTQTTTTAAIIALIGTCAFRLVWIYTVFEHVHTLEAIYISYPISWVLTGAVQLYLPPQ